MTAVDLAALRARLAEAETAARAAIDATRCGCHSIPAGAWTFTGYDSGVSTADCGGHTVAIGAWEDLEPAIGEHIAACDPAWKLRLIARDRETLDRHYLDEDWLCACGHRLHCPDVLAVWRFWMETP